jgi:hypothetical protein
MIAVCDACHDAIHRGDMRIMDDDLYRWKAVPTRAKVPHVYVEPSDDPAFLLGTVSVHGTGNQGVVVFELSRSQRLEFALVDGDIVLLNLGIHPHKHKPLLKVVDGYVKLLDANLDYKVVPGHLCVAGSLMSTWVPQWARELLIDKDPLIGIAGLPLLDLQVEEPGLVRVQGVWIDEDVGFVITEQALWVLERGPRLATGIVGDGKESALYVVGPVGKALIGTAKQQRKR